jgi:uncharacterized membrane protein SpoIIM required for sporulation
MSKQRFLQRRTTDWQRFEALLKRWSTQTHARPSAAEITEFSQLSRKLANDLATIRDEDWGQSLVDHLNGLLSRGHQRLYQAPPARWSTIIEFLLAGFPRLFRARCGYFFVAAALFFVPLAVTWIVVQNDPTVALRIVPAEALSQYDQMYSSSDKTKAVEQDDQDDDASTTKTDDDSGSTSSSFDEDDHESFGNSRFGMAGFYVQHNVGIALQCFSRGILVGVGTVWTLLYNGIAIGCVAGYVLSRGYTEKFLSFVVTHGSFELTAIAIAGGAGLLLGDAWLHPGQRRLLESLRTRGLQAIQLAFGAGAMLIIAALIEGFWSPAAIPPLVKYSVGGTLWVVVALYLTFAGRTSR